MVAHLDIEQYFLSVPTGTACLCMMSGSEVSVSSHLGY